jgi:hypothetical protein
MEYLSVRELTASPKAAWKKLARESESAITNNGKPVAVMLHVGDGDFDETVQILRQTRSVRLRNNIWEEAAERGTLSDGEIEAEIQAARVLQSDAWIKWRASCVLRASI